MIKNIRLIPLNAACPTCGILIDPDSWPIQYKDDFFCTEEHLPPHVVRPSEFRRRLPYILTYAAACGVVALILQNPLFVGVFWIVGLYFVGGIHDQNKDLK